MMKILVTGASGNVGMHVVRELVLKGQSVVAGVRDVRRSAEILGQDIESVYLDFTDISTYEAALRDVDRVFLMRPPHLGKPEDLYPFIDAMKSHDVKLVSFLSLMGVEKNPIPPHHKIEKYIEMPDCLMRISDRVSSCRTLQESTLKKSGSEMKYSYLLE